MPLIASLQESLMEEEYPLPHEEERLQLASQGHRLCCLQLLLCLKMLHFTGLFSYSSYKEVQLLLSTRK
ncbi:hypothetical protein L6164_032890 [Bauhinia variegata]|uniref:Uncharacterized protein n=1 Tax=Bauhinia variegata TaxID=167791 RepID=A0ACB9KQ83_BAUVA|nr:hypothetical protein L6164_032890 [Bauhinia variegata]